LRHNYVRWNFQGTHLKRIFRMTEFDLINRYFTRPTPGAVLGVGDDSALLRVPSGMDLAVSTDMLVSGTHFLSDADPFLLGHKTLAVNLSDMAAMGAKPRWATLAIALPNADEVWLEKFSAGFFALADQHGVELIGGDTTRGPMNMCVTIMGEVPQGEALLRSGAQAGDEVWVSGRLGDAALALAHLQRRTVLSEAEFAVCRKALHQPQPRIELGLALRGLANCAIDISDGLLADLGHILEASEVGAHIDLIKLPVSLPVRLYYNQPLGIQCVLAGGDDYELCFTVPATRHAEVLLISAELDLPLTCVGEIVAGTGCIVHDAAGKPLKLENSGYDHFR
jgi:thiamine-monophosphate kinase